MGDEYEDEPLREMKIMGMAAEANDGPLTPEKGWYPGPPEATELPEEPLPETA